MFVIISYEDSDLQAGAGLDSTDIVGQNKSSHSFFSRRA